LRRRCGAARRKGEDAAEQLKAIYTRLIDIAQQSCRQAERVRAALQERAAGAAHRLVQQLSHFVPLVGQAIRQAARRVLQDAAVPAAEKLLSLLEPRPQVIQRHKPGQVVEFGRKVWLEEVDGGIVSRYVLLEQPGQDQPYLAGWGILTHNLRKIAATVVRRRLVRAARAVG
jgi:transposase, IS5 family